ncbi:MAG: alkaline phosphatase, partial [Chloroflexota bacterium]
DWGADIVLSGHDHMYERLIIDDFPYVINGLGGRAHYSSLTPRAGSIAHYIQNHGALKISAATDFFQLEFIDIEDQLIDSYTLLK